MQERPEACQVACPEELDGRLGHRFDLMQCTNHFASLLLRGRLLVLEDRRGTARGARKKEQDAALECALDVRATVQGLDADPVALEANGVESAKCRRVLVLPADRHTELFALHVRSQLRQLTVRKRQAAQR